MKTILGAVLVLCLMVAAFAIVSALLWWLVPLAFPLLPFTFGQAMALTGIMIIIGLPAMKN
jgi:hypothetical protein